MELDPNTHAINLTNLSEYLVVRNGIGTGLRVVERFRDMHPSMNESRIAFQQQQYEAMPTRPDAEEYPYAITAVQATLALRGLQNAGPTESRLARERRKMYREELEAILKPNTEQQIPKPE